MSYLVKIIAYRRLASGTPLSSLCKHCLHRSEASQHTVHMQTVRRRVYVWQDVLSSIQHTRNSVSAQCLNALNTHPMLTAIKLLAKKNFRTYVWI